MAVDWAEKDDGELLGLIQSGSHYAFGVLVRRHTERFYHLAYRYVQNRETAEDIVQDAFLKLWEEPSRWMWSWTVWPGLKVFCRASWRSSKSWMGTLLIPTITSLARTPA